MVDYQPAQISLLSSPYIAITSVQRSNAKYGTCLALHATKLKLAVRPAGQWLELSVTDDGQGVPSTEIEHVFFAQRPRGPRAGAITAAAGRIVREHVSAGGA
ncbi:MAG TPA: ATP-binding protein [Chthoniobacterales bacterium]|nr:ATP-binding protein [Chthoniobacterales bacterium]